MGGALWARGQARLRLTGCEFVNNGGLGCLAGGAVCLGTVHPDPIPGHITFVGCHFVNNHVRALSLSLSLNLSLSLSLSFCPCSLPLSHFFCLCVFHLICMCVYVSLSVRVQVISDHVMTAKSHLRIACVCGSLYVSVCVLKRFLLSIHEYT